MALGTGSFGNAEDVSLEESVAIVNLAIDLGVTFIDTAPLYKKAEEAVGRALGPRRKEVVLATKVWADTVAEAEASLANSFEVLKTDVVDILYLHSLGNRSDDAVRPDGPLLAWLAGRRKAGACRFIGVSGHNRPDRFVPLIETGEVDVAMMNMNYQNAAIVRRFTPLTEAERASTLALGKELAAAWGPHYGPVGE